MPEDTVDQLYRRIPHIRSVISEAISQQISYIGEYFTVDKFYWGYFTVDQFYRGYFTPYQVISEDISLWITSL
jgi:hypothetical protein